MPRQFCPRFYSGLPAAQALYRLYVNGGDRELIEYQLKQLEGAVDAPWAALLLIAGLEEERTNELPESEAKRLEALMDRASAINKPSWWDKSMEEH